MRWALPDCLVCACTRGFGALASEWGPAPRQSGPDVNSLQGAVLGAPETDWSLSRLGKVSSEPALAGEVLPCREGGYPLPWLLPCVLGGRREGTGQAGRPHEEPGGQGRAGCRGRAGTAAQGPGSG